MKEGQVNVLELRQCFSS